MNPKLRENLEYFVDGNKEFGYLRSISKLSKVDYNKLLDYCFDTYNWYRKDNVPVRESKIQSLCITTMYAKGIMLKNEECELNDNES